MATTGVLGATWRADVTPWGAIVPWDGTPPLDWHVAADDRWHVPSAERTVRQSRVAGTPVFETRLRVPGGDAVHRAWSVADAGGHTVIELTNDSPLPFAVALGRRDLRTSRPPADVPILGIDLPVDAIVVPVGHRSSVTVTLPHDASGPGALPARLAPADAVARAWRATTERASRLELPDDAAVDRVVTERCELLLAGPPDPAADPMGFLLGVGELVRMGDPPGPWVDDVAEAVETVTRAGTDDVMLDAVLLAAGLVLARAGERRAGRDLARLVAGRPSPGAPAGDEVPVGVRAVTAVEGVLARGGELLPGGIPASWHGASIEAHGLVAGPSTALSYAIRWHGSRPAVLWDVTGEPVELQAPAVDPAWRTAATSGEALWAVSGQ